MHRSADPCATRWCLRNNDPTRARGHIGEDHRHRAEPTPYRSGQKRHVLRRPRAATRRISIVATSAVTTTGATTAVNDCVGSIVVRKYVTGECVPPTGPSLIVVDGDNSFKLTVSLVARAQATVDFPGRYQTGSVAIGEVAGGDRYTISEPDPLGALASVDPTLVTIPNGQSQIVTVTNQYDAIPPEPPTARAPRAAGAAAAAAPARPAPPAPRPRPRPRGVAGRRRGPGGQRDACPRASARSATWCRSPPACATTARCPRSTRSRARSRRSIRAAPTRWRGSSA